MPRLREEVALRHAGHPATGLQEAVTAPVILFSLGVPEDLGRDVPRDDLSLAVSEDARLRKQHPVEQLDIVTFTITPQVHAFDNLSLVECIDAQVENIVSARAIVGDKPLIVGPITLKPPFNPNATGPAPEAGPDELPPEDSKDPELPPDAAPDASEGPGPVPEPVPSTWPPDVPVPPPVPEPVDADSPSVAVPIPG